MKVFAPVLWSVVRYNLGKQTLKKPKLVSVLSVNMMSGKKQLGIMSFLRKDGEEPPKKKKKVEKERKQQQQPQQQQQQQQAVYSKRISS
eukprot:m.332482 g.332482  ORF g.332482 m.332482 type:complete len:89 (+) comp16955_c0_seq1:53-319(+)